MSRILIGLIHRYCGRIGPANRLLSPKIFPREKPSSYLYDGLYSYAHFFLPGEKIKESLYLSRCLLHVAKKATKPYKMLLRARKT